MSDSETAVLEAAYEGRGDRIAALERERDRLREALTLVVEAWDKGGELDLMAALVAARDLIAVPRRGMRPTPTQKGPNPNE